MRFNARRAHLEELPGIIGVARVGRRAAQVAAAVRPGDIVAIDQHDLDEETADKLVARGVVAVVNAAPMISARYANLGPAVLQRAGVTMVESVGRDGWAALSNGRPVRVHDGDVFLGSDLVARGRVVTEERLREEMDQARSGLSAQLDTLVHNAGEFLRREQEMLLDGRGLPVLRSVFDARPALVVGSCDAEELSGLRSLVADRSPVVIAVGAAADELLAYGWVADIVVTQVVESELMPSVDAMRAARDVVLVCAPGSGSAVREAVESIERLGVDAARVDTTATAEDVALLLADRNGATAVVGVGLRTRLEDFLDRTEAGLASTFATRLKVGSRLVDASAVPALEGSGVGTGPVVALIAVGVLAVLGAVSATPVGQEWVEVLSDQFGSLL